MVTPDLKRLIDFAKVKATEPDFLEKMAHRRPPKLTVGLRLGRSGVSPELGTDTPAPPYLTPMRRSQPIEPPPLGRVRPR